MSEEQQVIIDNLMELGALRKGMFTAVGSGHYVLYTEHGPLDVILDDLTKGETNE